jgi:hypothetical protein
MFNLIPSVTLDKLLVLSKTVKSVYVQDKTLLITTDWQSNGTRKQYPTY